MVLKEKITHYTVQLTWIKHLLLSKQLTQPENFQWNFAAKVATT